MTCPDSTGSCRSKRHQLHRAWRTENGRRVFGCRLSLCVVLAMLTSIAPLAASARAEDGVVTLHWWHERPEWRNDYRADTYDFYSAPPMVYPTPGYSMLPTSTLNRSLPFVFR
jgi:hypothetical protein